MKKLNIIIGFIFSIACIFTSCQQAAPVADTTPPSAVTEVKVVSESGKVILTWKDPADEDLYGIKIYNAAEVSRAASLSDGVLVKKGVQRYEVSRLTDNKSYVFKLSAVDKSLNESAVVTTESILYRKNAIPEGFVFLDSANVTRSTENATSMFNIASKETPVKVNKFYMAETETTYEKWYEVLIWALNNGYSFTSQGGEGTGNKPVVSIHWTDAVVWCNAASEKEGLEPVYYVKDSTQADFGNSSKVLRSLPFELATNYGVKLPAKVVMNPNANGYRLPTEIEWEYAARGGNPNDPAWNYTYSGSNTITDVAWFTNNSGSATHDVKTKAPNTAGLYDMSGNVWEWVWYSAKEEYVGHGGGWDDSTDWCTVTTRYAVQPTYITNFVGFRLARSFIE